jgi:integrase
VEGHGTGLYDDKGKGNRTRNAKRKLDAVLKKANLPHCRIHDLRHFYATLLLAQGVSLKVIQSLLGHTQISTTADIYTAVLPALHKEAADLMDSVLSGRG